MFRECLPSPSRPFRPLHCADTVPLPGRCTALLHTAYCRCCARLLLQAGAPTSLYLGQPLQAQPKPPRVCQGSDLSSLGTGPPGPGSLNDWGRMPPVCYPRAGAAGCCVFSGFCADLGPSQGGFDLGVRDVSSASCWAAGPSLNPFYELRDPTRY